MKVIKNLFILVAGIIAGVALTIFILRPIYNDDQIASELTIKLHQIQDFNLMNDKDEKFSYCFRYDTALINIELIKNELSEINYDDSFVSLKMSVDWAKSEIEKFENIKKHNLKYQCKKP